MELYTQTEAARVAVERERRVAGQHTNGHHHHHGGNGHANGTAVEGAALEPAKTAPRPEVVPPAA